MRANVRFGIGVDILVGAWRAEPSLQLGTLSTRIANLLCIIHSALARLSCTAHTLGPGGPLPHADRRATDTTYQPANRPDTRTRGRVRAGPSLQLATLSTRIALYTRRSNRVEQTWLIIRPYTVIVIAWVVLHMTVWSTFCCIWTTQNRCHSNDRNSITVGYSHTR